MLIRDRIRELRRIPAKELRPHPSNWRSHPQSQKNALQGILSEIGYSDALIARELADGTVMLVKVIPRYSYYGEYVSSC